MKPGRTVWVAVLLLGLVVVAAGLSGTAHFGGPRFTPHLSSGSSTARPHAFAPTPQAAPRPSSPGSSSFTSWVLILLAGVAALAVLYILRILWNRRRFRAPINRITPRVHTTTTAVTHAPKAEVAVLLTGIEAALRALDEPREPGDAIVQAWLGLEETAEESGVIRRPSETPTEFTSRILQGAFADDRAIQTMLRLYLRTRFGDHPPTAADVAAVRAALQRLVSSRRPSTGVQR